MPSGKRFRITINKVLYDMSPEQFVLLSKKNFSLKLDAPYVDLQRAEGLVTKKLFTVEYNTKGSKFIRTPLGVTIYKEIMNRK